MAGPRPDVRPVACAPYLANGHDPRDFDLIIVELPHTKNHMYDAWAEMNLGVDAPGATPADLRSLGHADLRRADGPARRGCDLRAARRGPWPLMRVEAVDFFYLAMPEITDEADGSQDALLVRVAAGGNVGWGECEAAPLPSIAAFVCPKSHGVCRSVGEAVLGTRIDGPEDIAAISARVGYESMDLLQAPHTRSRAWRWRSGTSSAAPAASRSGGSSGIPARSRKPPIPPSSSATPRRRRSGAPAPPGRAASGPPSSAGAPSAAARRRRTADQFVAAREGLGPDGILLVDVGQIFGEDVERAGRAPDGPSRK